MTRIALISLLVLTACESVDDVNVGVQQPSCVLFCFLIDNDVKETP